MLFDCIEQTGRTVKRIYRPKISSGSGIKSRCCGVEIERKIFEEQDVSISDPRADLFREFYKEQQKKWQQEQIQRQLEPIKMNYIRNTTTIQEPFLGIEL